MDKIRILLITAVVLSVASLSNAISIIYVDVNGPNDPGTGTAESPFLKIQNAINAANVGDIVEIRPGVYTADPNNYDLDPNGKSITIRSADPNNPEVVANTIIDPNGAGRGFYLHSGEDANCVISGLTIRNACTAAGVAGYNGAGIYCCYESSPTINNCVIQNGYAVHGSGGGICLEDSSAVVMNCTITGNIADYYGGGISSSFSSPTIIGCTISGNTAVGEESEGEGGGIDSGASDLNILNCVIINNNAFVGGGINCYYPGVTNMLNCTLAKNSADDLGGAVYCWYESSVNIKNSIFWANSAGEGAQIGLEDEGTASVTYCNMQGGQTEIFDPYDLLVWGSGNIDADPCFALFDVNGDPNLWDFHLQSAYGRWDTNSQNWVYDANTSLCIDAGDPNSDWSNELWPNGKRINIGAYGGMNQASMNGNRADFDINGTVDFADFAELSNRWLTEEICIEDLTSNNLVDFGDVAVFAENWLWYKE